MRAFKDNIGHIRKPTYTADCSKILHQLQELHKNIIIIINVIKSAAFNDWLSYVVRAFKEKSAQIKYGLTIIIVVHY